MADTVAMRRAFERNARIVTTRPAVAQKTYVTRVHIRDGLTCDIEEGPWTLTADLSTIAVGNANIGKRKPLFTRKITVRGWISLGWLSPQ